MMTKSKNIILAILLLFPVLSGNPLNAQSPYEADWLKELVITGVGLGSAVLASSLDAQLKPLTREEINTLDRNSINSFDRWATNNYSTNVSKASDILAVTLGLSPLALLAGKEVRNDFFIVGGMYFETLLFSVFTPTYPKDLVKRIRPFAYNPSAPIDKKLDVDSRRSFFSGHTCVTFSSAVFLATVYGDYYPDSQYKNYVWGGALIVASAVDFLRIEAGAHFPTDVIAGAIVGSAIGWAIPALHRTGSGKSSTSLNVYPGGMSFVYKF
jgi:hypothetical protein